MDWIKNAAKRAKAAAQEAAHEPAAAAAPGPAAQAPTPGPTLAPVRVDHMTTQVRLLGRQASNFPHVFRDGGGGGTVNGHHVIIFSDSMYTRGLPPTEEGRIVSFVSNSLGVLGPRDDAATTIARVTDVGTAERGPDQAVPFLTEAGETPFGTAVWPNQNIATVPDGEGGDDGDFGVAFPEVIDRNLFRQQKEALVYNTAIAIRVAAPPPAGRPVVTRPVQSLFVRGEPMYGSFAVVTGGVGNGGPDGDDGYLYLFGRVSEAARPASNGLKLARVRRSAWADRAQYTFWDGRQFGPQMPALDDGGAASVFRYSQEAFGKHYGPGTGDIWWSPVCRAYVMLFQNAAAALDDSLYLSYSVALTGGWSKPVSVFKIPRAPDGFSYAFHAYPNMDPTGRVVPLSWTQDSKAQSCAIYTAEMSFS